MKHELLLITGISIALPGTYLFLRRAFFPKQEVADAIRFIQGDDGPEATKMADAELEACVKHYLWSTTPLFGCLALLGWLMIGAAIF
jgi:hypothetical protein